MAGSSGFSISISAVDKTTATLDRINSKIAGAQNAINRRLETATAPMKRLQTQLGRTVNLLGGGKLYRGVTDVSKGFEGLTRSSYGAFGNISRIVDPLGIITGAATIAGLTALEQRFASLGQTLTNTGALMNMDPARLAQWENAGKLVGVSSGETDSSLRGLQRSATDARFGMNNQAAGMLQNILGKDWEKQSQDLPGTVMKISAYLQKLKGSARANAIGNIESTFGFSDGFMSELLRGPAALQANLKKAGAHGSPTDAQIGQGDSLAQSINGAQQSVEGLATAISNKLAGPLQKIIDRFTKWTDANRNLISQKIGNTIEDIANKMASINLKPIEQIAARINAIVQSIGGWQAAIIGVLAVLTASKVASIALPFVQLSAAIAGLSSGPGSFGALGRALTAAGFAVAGGEITRLAVQAAGGGQAAATVAGDAVTGAIAGGAIFGPVGAGIGGALGAGYGLYETHQETKEQQAARADDMTSYYRSQGLSAVQAAALVGGFQQESSLDPTRSNASGHYGLAQWDPARQADFKAQFGHDIRQSTLQEQMQFSLDELFNGKEGDAGRRLLAAKTAPEATEAALSYERPATPGTPAWENEKTWRLDKTSQILAREKGGAKYLPQIDPEGNAGAYPTDDEPTRLLGVSQRGAGMDREDRSAPPLAPQPGVSADRDDRMQVEVTVNHQGNVTAAKATHNKKPTLTNLRIVTPMPGGVS